MTGATVDKEALFATLPPVWPEPLLDKIRRRIEASQKRLIILDDDPTGAQTSHGVPVLTQWTEDLLAEEIEQSPAFFLLTNSRALDEASAVQCARDVGAALRKAARKTGRELLVASRSDSTLRGHFPAELDALADALAESAASASRPSYLFVPYFAEGGRFTVNDTQYVLQSDQLVPAGRTEFARDAAFAYRHSHLPSWIEEKTHGRVRVADVLCLTLDDLRVGGPAAVTAKLIAAPDGGVVIANAADDRDLEVLVLGLMDAEAAGKRFLYRTAASFVRVRAGITLRPLLTSPEVQGEGSTGGLVVVGSYIERTSEQLARALVATKLTPVEVSVDALLATRHEEEAEIARVSITASSLLAAGRDAAVFTSRSVRLGASAGESLRIGQQVSRDLCAVVEGLTAAPRFLIAKGGNTASELATRALGVQRAVVLGQLLPGVPVWELGPESRFPGLRYVVFPGNVGEPDSLAEAVGAFTDR